MSRNLYHYVSPYGFIFRQCIAKRLAHNFIRKGIVANIPFHTNLHCYCITFTEPYTSWMELLVRKANKGRRKIFDKFLGKYEFLKEMSSDSTVGWKAMILWRGDPTGPLYTFSWFFLWLIHMLSISLSSSNPIRLLRYSHHHLFSRFTHFLTFLSTFHL